MLFIGLQRGWLSVQGGCCLKQCSLNKRGRSSRRALWLMCSLSVSVHHAAVILPFIPFQFSHAGHQEYLHKIPQKSFFPTYALFTVYLNSLLLLPCVSFPAVLWSFSLPAARTTNFCTASRPRRRVPVASSPPLPPSQSPNRPRQTAAASFHLTSPSSRGARPWTWQHSAVPPMAMQACTPPCLPSARPPSTSTSSMCPRWPVKCLTTGRPSLTAKLRSLSSTSKVSHSHTRDYVKFSWASHVFWFHILLLFLPPLRLFNGTDE